MIILYNGYAIANDSIQWILEKEKGIPKEYMLEKVEAALVSAFKREQGGNSNVKIVLNPEKKDMKVLNSNIMSTLI